MKIQRNQVWDQEVKGKDMEKREEKKGGRVKGVCACVENQPAVIGEQGLQYLGIGSGKGRHDAFKTSFSWYFFMLEFMQISARLMTD